ncbi:hypothetical protein [Lentzea sp. NPDC060358]|uniref:hypothetical protein n=1 Tax=Lentzea sp. NPDC060358 TaxID=3347103 RepID=UPI003650686A
MTAVVVFVVVVVVVLEEEDGADDELAADDTDSDVVSDGVGSNEGVLMSETRALPSPSGATGSPDANDPTSGAST